MTPLTLVLGPAGSDREHAIAAEIATWGPRAPGVRVAAILEGLPTGQATLLASATLDLHRIAPGCLCCTGNLVLRVTLNRLLRRPPDHLFIGMASLEHLDQLRSWLSNSPYDQLLELRPDLRT